MTRNTIAHTAGIGRQPFGLAVSETCVDACLSWSTAYPTGSHANRPRILEALQTILDEIEMLISTTTPLPENRTTRCLELLRAAKALTNDLQNR
jgi:hypothetical protein